VEEYYTQIFTAAPVLEMGTPGFMGGKHFFCCVSGRMGDVVPNTGSKDFGPDARKVVI
jgi:hypothetical protein